jgi:hypothetical protein
LPIRSKYTAILVEQVVQILVYFEDVTKALSKDAITLSDAIPLKKNIYTGVPELAPQRKQACADNKKDSKLTKINFLLAQIIELQSF